MFFVGPPLPPSVEYSPVDENTLHVSWEEPYAPEDFPIISYYIAVEDTFSGVLQLEYEQLSNETFSFDVTQMNAMNCTNLTMMVWAESILGNSTAGVTYGAFPARELNCISSD
jgi:hypothetical protein